jgi:hypothetical protein
VTSTRPRDHGAPPSVHDGVARAPRFAYRRGVDTAPVPFGRYVLKERLAQGGMGEVFRAVAVGEHGFEKPVVVKRILPAHAGRDDLADLFIAEANLMTRLAHPNIVEVLDFGRGEHRDYYLVLELVEGVDLGRLSRAFAARGELFPVPLALFVVAQVLRGLHHAHTKLAAEGGVLVHRDVSPSNVLCSTEGEVKVADFGVALVSQRGAGPAGDGVVGKPGYMAPEQFAGGLVDPRADVFSTGVVLYQMLTGALPFTGDTPEAQQEAARRGERRRARDVRGEVSEELEAIVARALAPSPDARFGDARAMAQAIAGLGDRGQRIAGGDDLAEAVRAARRALPAAGKRVIALSSAAPPPGGAANDPMTRREGEPEAPDDAPRELTRTGVRGAVGAFTLRFPVRADATTRSDRSPDLAGLAERSVLPGERRTVDPYATPEPRTERIAIEERVAPPAETEEEAAPSGSPRQRAVRWAALGVVLLVAVLGAIPLARRLASSTAPSTGSSSAATTGSAPSPPDPPTAVTAPTAPAFSPPPTSRPLGRLPLARPPASAAPAPPSSAAPVVSAPPPDDDCRGAVRFTAPPLESYTVTGGPQTVQGPGLYRWPCRTFNLTARSRLDPTRIKSATVTVRPDREAAVDLK